MGEALDWRKAFRRDPGCRVCELGTKDEERMCWRCREVMPIAEELAEVLREHSGPRRQRAMKLAWWLVRQEDAREVQG